MNCAGMHGRSFINTVTECKSKTVCELDRVGLGDGRGGVKACTDQCLDRVDAFRQPVKPLERRKSTAGFQTSPFLEKFRIFFLEAYNRFRGIEGLVCFEDVTDRFSPCVRISMAIKVRPNRLLWICALERGSKMICKRTD